MNFKVKTKNGNFRILKMPPSKHFSAFFCYLRPDFDAALTMIPSADRCAWMAAPSSITFISSLRLLSWSRDVSVFRKRTKWSNKAPPSPPSYCNESDGSASNCTKFGFYQQHLVILVFRASNHLVQCLHLVLSVRRCSMDRWMTFVDKTRLVSHCSHSK